MGAFNFDFDDADRLAVRYLGASQGERERIAAEIAKLPHTPTARIVLWTILGIAALLIAALNVSFYLLHEAYNLNLVGLVLIDLFALAKILLVLSIYQRSKPSVYNLLERFSQRHPNSVHMRLVRNASGAIDWSKAGVFQKK